MNNVKKAEQEANHLKDIIERNIKTLVNRQQRENEKRPAEERLADRITAFTGNMAFVYIHIIVFSVWILWNLNWLPVRPFDPNFIGLGITTQVEAIFLTTFVLMTQRSLDAQADKRADLDLQISLLSEHEITRMINLVKAIAEKLDIKEVVTEEINQLAEDVAAEDIMDTMESHKG